MSNYIIRRILISIPILFIVTVIIFTLIELAPGDPIAAMLMGDEQFQMQIEDYEQMMEIQRRRLGLDQPPYIRYFRWLQQLFRLNLGNSLIYEETVLEMIAPRILPTILIMATAIIFSTLIGIIIGSISAVKQYSILDYSSTVISFLGISVPNFFLALLFIYIFSLRMGWLPSRGMYNIREGITVMGVARHMILPALVLSWDMMAHNIRYTRSAMLDVIKQDYINTARSKGLSERVVMFKHAFRNAMLPVVTIIGLRLQMLFGGSVIIETVFSWPGLGRLAIEAVYNKDYPVIMAFNLIIAIIVLLSNLLIDIVYSFIDPRIKYD